MTIDEFIERLRQTPRDWRIQNGRFIVRDLGTWADCACPITACVEPPLIALFHAKAGDQLGLCEGDRWSIIQAADRKYPHDPDLRARLLDACGLKEHP